VSKLPKAKSPGEELLAQHLACYQILAVREYQFDRERRWKADFFIQPDWLIEVEGATAFGKSRHSKGEGFENDCRKYGAATVAGYKVLRFSTAMVKSGEAIDFIRKALGIA
jgi:hypothetical protein